MSVCCKGKQPNPSQPAILIVVKFYLNKATQYLLEL